MQKTFVVDISKHRGDSRDIVAAVENHVVSKSPDAAARIKWLIRPDQSPLFRDAAVRVDAHSNADHRHGQCVVDWILQLSRNGSSGDAFHVLSYDTDVLNASGNMNPEVLVIPLHIRSFTRDVIPSRMPGPIGIQRRATDGSQPLTSSSMSVEEACHLMRQILQSGGHTSENRALHQPKLRLLMVAVDPRARKNSSDLQSLNLIRDAVRRGREEGWLKQTRWHEASGYEYIWLNDMSTETTAAMVENRSDRSSAVGMLREEAPAVATAGQQNITSDKTGLGAESVSDVSLGNVSAPELTRAAPTRAHAMELLLRTRGIGSPKLVRDYFFRAAEEIPHLNEKHTVTRLMNLVESRALELAKTDGLSVQPDKWKPVVKPFFNMMLLAEAFVDDHGDPIKPGLGAYSTRVSTLVADFRDVCEATLIKHIIERAGDVSLADLKALGVALFHHARSTPEEDMLERVDHLLVLLHKMNKITVDDRTGAIKTV